MKYKLIALFLLISTFVSGQIVGPKISVSDENYDFGKIAEGVEVSHKFNITNTGGDVLEIQRVRASCGCTAAAPEKDKLEPGESTAIEVRFNSAGRMGQQQKYVYISSNDPENPEIRLMFKAFVVDKSEFENKEAVYPKLEMETYHKDFGTVDEGSVLDWEVNFVNSGEDDLVIKRVKTSCGCTAAVLSGKILKSAEKGNLKIELDTAKREGKMTRTVTLYSNDPQQPVQTITLEVNVQKRKS